MVSEGHNYIGDVVDDSDLRKLARLRLPTIFPCRAVAAMRARR